MRTTTYDPAHRALRLPGPGLWLTRFPCPQPLNLGEMEVLKYYPSGLVQTPFTAIPPLLPSFRPAFYGVPGAGDHLSPRGWPRSTVLIVLSLACFCFPCTRPARP